VLFSPAGARAFPPSAITAVGASGGGVIGSADAS
jgi:hypothetical protein